MSGIATILFLVATACWLLLLPGPPAEPAALPDLFRFPVTEHTLRNGMRFLLEHMMFKGSTLFGTTDPERERPLLEKIDALQTALQTERVAGRRGQARDPARAAALEQEVAALEAEARQFIITNLTRPQAEAHFRTYYAPNNALAVLVGDLDPAEVIHLAEEYFGSIPAQSVPPSPILAEPPQAGERRLRVEFPAEPDLLMLYQAPPLGHPDTYPLRVLGTLLGDGRSSRLHQRLVEEQRVASSISAGPWLLQHAGLFLVQATPRAPHPPEEVEAAIETQIAAFQAEPVTDRELTKVRNQMEVALVRSLASNTGLASTLGNAWALRGDWTSSGSPGSTSDPTPRPSWWGGTPPSARRPSRNSARCAASPSLSRSEAGAGPARARRQGSNLQSEICNLTYVPPFPPFSR